MKRNEPRKESYKMYNLRRKGIPESRMELNPVFKEINTLKKIFTLNEIQGVVTSGQIPTQVSFQFVKRLRQLDL